MKLKNKEIIESINAINSLADKDMPIAITYFFINNYKKLCDSYEIYNKAREKAKDNKELMELLELETEVDIELIDKQDLIDANITLTPKQLIDLKRLING